MPHKVKLSRRTVFYMKGLHWGGTKIRGAAIQSIVRTGRTIDFYHYLPVTTLS